MTQIWWLTLIAQLTHDNVSITLEKVEKKIAEHSYDMM
jgi:hypothetical protein